eukprot:15466304-Alexandrium_andersonii.AAC.2
MPACTRGTRAPLLSQERAGGSRPRAWRASQDRSAKTPGCAPRAHPRATWPRTSDRSVERVRARSGAAERTASSGTTSGKGYWLRPAIPHPSALIEDQATQVVPATSTRHALVRWRALAEGKHLQALPHFRHGAVMLRENSTCTKIFLAGATQHCPNSATQSDLEGARPSALTAEVWIAALTRSGRGWT